jgi:hypothetical protein
MNSSTLAPITIHLDRLAHYYAGLFASQQVTPQKGKQVYLNTLAVCAVNSYLRWLSVPTRLEQGDTWNSIMRSLLDTADLVIPQLGKLECRAILPEENTVTLPPEVMSDRLGYVVVQVSECLTRVNLLGFLPPQNLEQIPQPIPLHRLQSLDRLIDKLHEEPCVRLGQWFAGFFSPDWVPLYAFRGATMELAPRSTEESPRQLSRAKVFTGKQNEQDVSLLVVLRILQISETEVEIRLQVYPHGLTICLPMGLEVKIFDEQGLESMHGIAGSNNDGLELTFRCAQQESFALLITADNLLFREQFIV